MTQQSHTHTSTISPTHQLALSVWDESPYTLSHEGKRCQRIHTQQIRFPLCRMSPNSSYATKHQLAGEKQEIFFPLIIDHLRLLSWSTRGVNMSESAGNWFKSNFCKTIQNESILTWLWLDSIQWPRIIVKFSKEFWALNVTACMVIYHDKTHQFTTSLSVTQIKVNVVNINGKPEKLQKMQILLQPFGQWNSVSRWSISVNHMVHEASLHRLVGGTHILTKYRSWMHWVYIARKVALENCF